MEFTQKNKVIHVITKSNWGGAQRYVYDLATSLPSDLYDQEVIVGGNGPLMTKLREAGVSVMSLSELGRDVNLAKDWASFKALFLEFRRKKPDVIHLNSSKIGALGSLAGRLAGVRRIIFTAHGWAFNEDRPFYIKYLLKAVYWTTLLLAHETIAVSENMRSQTRHWPWVQDKITVVHNGIAKNAGFSKANARTELMRLSPALRTRVESAPKTIPWVGTVAELHHVKGYSYAIEALASMRGAAIYVVIGEGEERATLEAAIADNGLEDTVFLLGHVDRAAEYISAFDIFLLPSISEALSYSILEAGLTGLPVVATTVGGIPEVVEDMRSGVLVQPKNSRELAHALSFMIEHPTDRKKYSAALKERVVSLFSLDRMARETAEVYARTEEV